MKNKYELRSDELREDISSRYGSDVELMNLKHGIFDEACISVISLGTVHGVGANQDETLTFLDFDETCDRNR